MLTQKGTQRLTVGGIRGVSSYTLIKGIPWKINKEHKQMLCSEKSLVLLMYNAGLSQSLQRRGKNHSHLWSAKSKAVLHLSPTPSVNSLT